VLAYVVGAPQALIVVARLLARCCIRVPVRRGASAPSFIPAASMQGGIDSKVGGRHHGAGAAFKGAARDTDSNAVQTGARIPLSRGNRCVIDNAIPAEDSNLRCGFAAV
jgi:hypothetical protein